MSKRKTALVPGEYYHVYNRGVEKRLIFEEPKDTQRFFQVMKVFNSQQAVGSLYEYVRDNKEEEEERKPLVEFISFCLNPNHFHFIISPLVENGIERFMQRLGTGYTMYFNKKYRRSGALFQGKYKASHINSNEYLLRVSVYVNLNDKTHNLKGPLTEVVHSSWKEFVSGEKGLCNKDIVSSQFDSPADFRRFALATLPEIMEQKEKRKELAQLLVD